MLDVRTQHFNSTIMLDARTQHFNLTFESPNSNMAEVFNEKYQQEVFNKDYSLPIIIQTHIMHFKNYVNLIIGKQVALKESLFLL